MATAGEPLTDQERLARARIRLCLVESWRRSDVHDLEIARLTREIRDLTDIPRQRVALDDLDNRPHTT